MGILEMPNNSAIKSKLNLKTDWSFQISVSDTPSTHISYTLDKTNMIYTDDKIIIPVKCNGYVVD